MSWNSTCFLAMGKGPRRCSRARRFLCPEHRYFSLVLLPWGMGLEGYAEAVYLVILILQISIASRRCPHTSPALFLPLWDSNLGQSVEFLQSVRIVCMTANFSGSVAEFKAS